MSISTLIKKSLTHTIVNIELDRLTFFYKPLESNYKLEN